MAFSDARSPRPMPRPPRSTHEVHPPRRFGSLRSDRTSDRDGDELARRDPAWLIDLSERIAHLVAAVERVSERVGTMREDNSYLRAMTADLCEALRVERAQSERRLSEQGRSVGLQMRLATQTGRSADLLAGIARRPSDRAGERFRRAV